MTKKPLGIYVHIPLCKSKCRYCDFCSYVMRDEATVSRYIDRVCEEIGGFSPDAREYRVDSIYFGGGTPTLLTEEHFSRLMSRIYDGYDIADNCEITAECNPATGNVGYFRALRALGINRMSIGFQSASDEELITLGRAHNFSDCVTTYNHIREAGFDNVSADLIYGIPGQNAESQLRSLRAVTELAPEHLSLYSLKIEEGTYFYKNREKYEFPDGDAQYNMYMQSTEYLRDAGYRRYEISNFSRGGNYPSRHNLKYWTGGDYIGFGLAAYSFFGRKRFNHGRNLRQYLDGTESNAAPEFISDGEARREYIMLRLRLEGGFDTEDYKARFGEDFFARYKEQTEKYLRLGLAVSDGKYFSLTSDGMMISNMILSELLY